MFHRGFALLAVLAVAPAHATLIEYSFTAELTGARSVPFSVLGEFGLPVYGPSYVTGGLLFDDAAPRTSYEEGHLAGASSSTYEMSNLRLWVNVGDYVLTATGGALSIHDDPAALCGPNCRKDTWDLGARGDGDEVNGHTVTGIGIHLEQYGGDALTSSELQVPDMAEWDHPFIDGSYFRIGLGNATLGGWLRSIAPTTTSVPEPATLSLLGVGALGALATRRRRHVAAGA